MNYTAVTSSTHYAQDVGFFGNIRPRLSRSQMLQEMQQVCANEGLKIKIHQVDGVIVVVPWFSSFLSPHGLFSSCPLFLVLCLWITLNQNYT